MVTHTNCAYWYSNKQVIVGETHLIIVQCKFKLYDNGGSFREVEMVANLFEQWE